MLGQNLEDVHPLRAIGFQNVKPSGLYRVGFPVRLSDFFAVSLIQMAKGEKTDNGYGEDLIKLFRGSGEEATVMLLSKLRGCEDFNQHSQERRAVEYAEQIAEQFLKDFGQLEGA